MQLEQFRAHFKAEQSHWWFRGRRRILIELAQKLVDPWDRPLVLDIGCGTGGNVRAMAQHYQAVGVDASAEAIAIARECHPGGHYLVGALPADAAPYSAAAQLFLCTDVLEHIEADSEFLARWVAAAPEGAYFLLTVPADMALWSPHDVSHGHFRRYSLETWQKVWSKLPVENLLTSYCNSTLYPVIRLLRTISAWRGQSWGTANTDLGLPWAPINAALEWLFARERHRLGQLLLGRGQPFPHGVSLISVLRKTA